MRASVHIEKLNCTCMNCVALIRNLFNLIGICSNLILCIVAYSVWHNLRSFSNLFKNIVNNMWQVVLEKFIYKFMFRYGSIFQWFSGCYSCI